MSDDTSGVRFPPPLVFVAGLLAGWMLERMWPASVFDGRGWWLVAIPLGAAGFALMFAALGLFRRAGTDPLPMRPTTALVFDGPYRFTRNPMYLGMTFVYLALTMLFDLPWALVLLPLVIVVIRTQVIEREERYLEAKFGDEYRAYRDRVRRWL
ncbi:MAG TPA: isoprenylcysteine carboxylmethyltransferase family protein [Longimicrobiales bacterium]